MRNHKPHVSQKAAWAVLAIFFFVAIVSAISQYLKSAYGLDFHI